MSAFDFLINKDFITIQCVSNTEILKIMDLASYLKTQVKLNGGVNWCNSKILGNLFYEPSTRTSSSFHTAMLRLGGQVLSITDVSNSSVAKGETLDDTIKCLQSYCDLIVLRHPVTGSATVAANAARIPVLNAGDGIGEHPTQACLDLFTIIDRLKRVNGLNITMLGDLKHGRTVHSLSKLLAHFDVTVNFVSPQLLSMPPSLLEELKDAGLKHFCTNNLEDVLQSTDVLYVTRVQKERFASENEYNAVANSFVINAEIMKKAKCDMIVMHPLPRIKEIDTDFDEDPRAAYFEQMENGMYVRMALIALVMGKVPKDLITSNI